MIETITRGSGKGVRTMTTHPQYSPVDSVSLALLKVISARYGILRTGTPTYQNSL